MDIKNIDSHGNVITDIDWSVWQREHIEERYDDAGNLTELVSYCSMIPDNILLDNLRERRNSECFSIVNRGFAWYDRLTPAQMDEFDAWYQDWLDVTETRVVPERPAWII